MARIGYVGEGTNFRKILNNSAAVSKAYWDLRKALNDGVLPAKLRMLSFLSADLVNRCEY